ncbi:uncharacterized protein JN550_013226 [Neoarthrinium moseri]|uniref:uncharacterized protein n=1 Tax=Neoarthrinium moseri TaxID=1658444 RepID=UPI001FDD2F7C|nr:uncharacterized protein JN550_013226 [Neoarthrinium moseri]KAI1857408.1 hypothetical protein JN550_013226 [Neoarthrinium moseri]
MARKNTPKGKRGGGPPAGRSRGGGGRGRGGGRGGGGVGGPNAGLDILASFRPISPFLRSGAPGHSLADEARNTSKRPRAFGNLDGRLRHKPVTFVSAGLMHPLKELEVQPEATENEPVKPAPVPAEEEVVVDPEAVPPEATHVPAEEEMPAAVQVTEPPASAAQPFVVDTAGDKALRPGKQQPVIVPDHDSDMESDSSDEVILFKGRDPALRQAVQSQSQSRAPSTPGNYTDSIQLREMDVEIKVVEKSIELEQRPVVEESMHRPSERLLAEEATAAADMATPRDNEPSRLDVLLDNTHSDEEAALIADYIANMDSDEAGEDGDESDNHPGLGSHAFHLLRDIGGTDSDAVPEDSSEDESGEEKSDEGEDEEPESAEAQRRRMELEDERMARLLAKQQELGFGGDDLMLYDDVGEDDDQGEWQIAPRATPRRKKKGASKKAKIVQKKGQYPSATAMAEAFDDLDLMDWHRAALDTFNQAAKRASTFTHDDSDLEEAMNLSFQKDRLKKAEKKKQREALRAQGLLGKNVNPNDLRVKYPVGMSKDDMAFELEQFLVGTVEQIAFPPLDKHARKLLHTVASHLKIKSQSSGSGDSRHPVLFRTARTVSYDEGQLDAIVNRVLKRSFFTRVDVDTETAKAYRSGPRKSSNLPRAHNAISYREGEVVGHHASELSSENKGRLLLEKMGWTKGQALGTEENKGIMVPVAHVMKRSKVGLGDVK